MFYSIMIISYASFLSVILTYFGLLSLFSKEGGVSKAEKISVSSFIVNLIGVSAGFDYNATLAARNIVNAYPQHLFVLHDALQNAYPIFLFLSIFFSLALIFTVGKRRNLAVFVSALTIFFESLVLFATLLI